MFSRRTVLAGAAGLALAPMALAQTSLRGGDLAGDVAILREAYEALHPGLLRYNTPEQMNARFDALARDWGRDQSLSAAYLSLSRFLATIKCGHTYANFYNQSDAVHRELFTARDRLPFRFVWLDNRMVVTENFSGDARLAPGAEVLTINGVGSPRILAQLMTYARADGSNDDKRRSLLQVRGEDEYETFDVFYSLLHPEAAQGFSLRVRPPGARRVAHADVDAIERTQVRGAAREAGADRNAPAWRLAYPRERVAQLIMPTWAVYNSDWDWRGFLDASFEEFQARGTQRLIVDLRGNEGGLDCGHEIIARLIDRDLPLSAYERRVRYRKTPAHLDPYLDTWDDSFRDWGDDAEPIDGRFYRLRASEEQQNRVITPKGPRFRGDVIVLIDSSNSSATFQFASIIHANGLGRLLGQPTGGNQRGINGGAFFFLRLPASGLECDLPLIGTFPSTPAPDAGVEPDIAVSRTVEDITAGRDGVLEAALALS